MSRLRLSLPRDTNKKKDRFQYKELDTCSHVFLRVFKVLIKGKVETVTADRVKLAHIERTPENGRTRQPKATPH